jgi:hypothetical protein
MNMSACRGSGTGLPRERGATFGLVAADTTPLTNDNTDIHAKVTNGRIRALRQISRLAQDRNAAFTRQQGGLAPSAFLERWPRDDISCSLKRLLKGCAPGAPSDRH